MNRATSSEDQLAEYVKKYKRYKSLRNLAPVLPKKLKREIDRRAQKYSRRQKELSSSLTHDRVQARRNLGAGTDLPSKISLCLGVVTYNNSGSELGRLVRSIDVAVDRVSAQVDIKVYVIDNGGESELPTTDLSITRLPARGNIGFPSAQNILITEAFSGGADFYIATNPDGFFHPDCLKNLFEMSASDGDLALIEALQFPAEHPKVYDVNTFDAEWVSGACLLISRNVYKRIGGFESDFFLYCDDVDLSWRARLAGIKVKTNPRALFYHDTTRGRPDPQVYIEMLKSGYKLAVKWNADEFANSLAKELGKMGIPATKGKISPIKGDTSFCDFSSRFYFSDVRW